jgi:hypothetical protein
MLLVNRMLMRHELDASSYEERVSELLERAMPGRGGVARYNRCIAYDYSRLRAA